MRKDRLLAFSDGVFAIIITIMVLELKVPHESTWAALAALAPKFGSYLLSFIYVAIYWNNHHHMLEPVQRINGATLWANMVLLFWLSLVPFATAWMGETHFAAVPTAIYGVTLLLPAIAYTLLQNTLIKAHPDNVLLKHAVGADWKGKISLVLYAAGIALASMQPWASLVLYAIVALIWLVPDRRIETAVATKHGSQKG
jgi:uncharacterized membrane protein